MCRLASHWPTPTAFKSKADSEIKSLYTLTDERVMSIPPVVRSKLVELGIQPRERFTICKAERQEGNRRFIECQVNKESDADERPPSETPPVNKTPTSIELKNHVSAPI